MKIVLLDISDSPDLTSSVNSFFADRPVTILRVANPALFEVHARKPKEYAMAIALVHSGNAHLMKVKVDVPTFVFQPHSYKQKKLLRFYLENGGGDG